MAPGGAEAAPALTGLTSAQVRERVAAGQTNAAPRPGGRSVWDIFRTNVFTWFNLILGVLFVAVGLLTLVESFALYAGGEYGVIDEMYVRPEYRGQDVERQLLDEAVAIATRRRWFHLDITGREGDRNERAARFSRGLGL